MSELLSAIACLAMIAGAGAKSNLGYALPIRQRRRIELPATKRNRWAGAGRI